MSQSSLLLNDDSQLKQGRHPTRDDLDKVSTEKPVLLIHQSGHLGAAKQGRHHGRHPDCDGAVFRAMVSPVSAPWTVKVVSANGLTIRCREMLPVEQLIDAGIAGEPCGAVQGAGTIVSLGHTPALSSRRPHIPTGDLPPQSPCTLLCKMLRTLCSIIYPHVHRKHANAPRASLRLVGIY
jgi:hypothetical protein